MKLSHTLYSTIALCLLLGLSMPGDAFAHGSAAPLVAESEAAKAEPKNSSAAEWLFNSFVKEANAASSVAISVKGAYRYIRSNGLPNHGTGRFPNRGNPNAIRAQSYRFKMPARPKLSGRITRLGRQPFGVAINGVVFDPGTAEYWRNDPRSGWRYEALGGAVRLGLDRNNAHVQPNGAYHYHAAPKGLMSRSNYRAKPMLIGWAADGFPIYTPFGFQDPESSKSGMKQLRSGYRIKRGTRPSGPGGRYDGSFVQDYAYVRGAGDLDACNGRTGVTPEFPGGTYYYVVTLSYPFVPRCFKGRPDSSFNRRGPGLHAFGRPGRFGPPGAGRPRGPGRFDSQGISGSRRQAATGFPPPGRSGAGGPGQPVFRTAGGFRPAGGPPRAALSVCRGKGQGARCSFNPPGRGRISGRCLTVPRGRTACVPDRPPR